MLPESNAFSDDTTMKSSNQKGSFEELYFVMERLGEIYGRFDEYFADERYCFRERFRREQRRWHNSAGTSQNFECKYSGIDILILIFLFGTGRCDGNNINTQFENSDFERKQCRN